MCCKKKSPPILHKMQLVKLEGNKVIFPPKLYAEFKRSAEKKGKDPERLLNELIENYLKNMKKAKEIVDYFFENTRSSCRAADDGNCEVIDNGIDLNKVVRIMNG